MSIGFDAGTYNLVCSRRVINTDKTIEIKHRKEVNCFLELPLENRFMFNMLKASKVHLIEREKIAYVVGQSAMDMAYTLPQIPIRRPMKDGCLNPQEKDAFRILSIMIHSLIGEVDKDKEIIYYTVPANAINQETDVDYHNSVLQSIFKAYKVNNKTVQAFPINEGLCLVFAELLEKQYTGIGISCLCPGTKIYTDKGIVNIEDVNIGDKVITHYGRWRPINKVIKRSYKGLSHKFQLQGYTNDTDNYKFVDNHELYVKRDGEWKWIGCEEVIEGDVVGEPIVCQDITKGKPTITIYERVTCSKLYTKKYYDVTGNMQRLIGYFMGDGSVSLSDGAIQFDFEINERQYIDDVKDILKLIFNKSSEVEYGENCTKVKCYSKGLSNWFNNHCYDEHRNKKYPWSLDRISKSDCVNLLAGLVRSDGGIGEDYLNFGSSNTHLVILAKQCFSRLGVPTSISFKDEWIVNSTTEGLSNIINNISCENNRLFIEDGFCCSVVQKIEYEEYEGIVYDLQVEEDHSFSGPFLTIHNCGAGQINLCYSIFSQPVFQMSLVNAGDWIDKMAAKACGETTTVINKEKTKIDLTKTPTTLVERAIKTQYEILIQKTVSAIKKAIIDAGTRANVEQPLDIILGGGTASPPGFVESFQEAIKDAQWSIPVGEIKRPADYLYSVARGALIAAENHCG